MTKQYTEDDVLYMIGLASLVQHNEWAANYQPPEWNTHGWRPSEYEVNDESIEDMADWGEADVSLKGVELEGFGVFSVVEEVGGEGEGDHAHIVVSLTDDTGLRFFRKDGYYASFHGYDWDGPFREVLQVEKTVVVYE